MSGDLGAILPCHGCGRLRWCIENLCGTCRALLAREQRRWCVWCGLPMGADHQGPPCAPETKPRYCAEDGYWLGNHQHRTEVSR